VLVRVGRARGCEIALQRRDAQLGRRHRGVGRSGVAARQQQNLVEALLLTLDLPLDHRQAILLAAQRGRVRVELRAEPRERLQVGLGLFRQLADVRFLRAPQLRFELGEPLLAALQLRGNERRRVLGLLFARLRRFVDEDRREAVRHALCPRRIGIRIRHQERVELARFVDQRHRVRNRDGHRRSEPADQLVVRRPGGETLLARDARQDGRRQQLLREGAHPLGVVERRGLAHQVRRHRRRNDTERRRAPVFLRQPSQQRGADAHRRDDRHDEPPFPAAEHGQVVEGMDVCVFHQ
jgi:hypothetical protein